MIMNISMVNAFVSLKTAGDDDQFKKELQYIIGHLICTLISENQGLAKLRSVLNL